MLMKCYVSQEQTHLGWTSQAAQDPARLQTFASNTHNPFFLWSFALQLQQASCVVPEGPL